MDQQKDNLEAISEIRSMMEKSTRFISLNGLSGVFAGIFAIIGAIPAFIYFGYGITSSQFMDYTRFEKDGINYDFYLLFFGDIAIVLLLSILVSVILTIRKAKKTGQAYFDKTAKRMLVNLFIPLITGGIFCLIMMYHEMHSIIAPATLIFYGLALLNASKYTLNDIRYLGLCEIILGLISAFFVGYGLIFWMIGFGLLHIIYGTAMYYKYER